MVKGYLIASGLFFLLIAALHLLRLIYRVPVLVGDWTAPLWMSVGGFIMPLALSLLAFWALNNTKKSQ